jgi:hypothetical protein
MNESKSPSSGGLSKRLQRACRVAWVDGLTHKEAGEREGLSKWASMKRVQRARRKLRASGIEPPAPRRPAHRVTVWQLGQLGL